MNRIFIPILLLILASALAQPYRCDWQVVASGGGQFTGAYHCGSTAGQTATGRLSGASLLALIGFWQPEIVTGIGETERFGQEGGVVQQTRLYPPAPNPFSGTVRLCYTLNREQRTRVQIYDLAGRAVLTLVDGVQPGGSYAVVWDGRDNSGNQVAHGLYLCRFTAGDYQATVKLLRPR
jgi:hypothetical protein